MYTHIYIYIYIYIHVSMHVCMYVCVGCYLYTTSSCPTGCNERKSGITGDLTNYRNSDESGCFIKKLGNIDYTLLWLIKYNVLCT